MISILLNPLFQWQSGTHLTKTRFVEEVRVALDASHLPAKNFAGHSFRIGAATTAASAGLPDSATYTDSQTLEELHLSSLHPDGAT